MSDYLKTGPIQTSIRADRQSARRHYGVHPYFTRRPYNVVRRYVVHYSREGDRVLDPFGGSGVTAIEAFLENRVGMQNDINPLANFIARGIADLSIGEAAEYQYGLASLEVGCRSKLAEIARMDEYSLARVQRNLDMPENIRLPSNSDVGEYYELFTPRQLTALAVVKNAIDALEPQHVRKGMLLAWSATLTKLNKTFLSAEGRAESRGGSSIFSIYRYKIAKEPIELPPWETFEERARNVISAKKEIDQEIEAKRQTKKGWHGRFELYSKDIGELAEQFAGRIDYIFTDPPYGGHISYLDLSTLWNSWLGQTPSMKARQNELIVGGELDLPEDAYVKRLGAAVEACLRMLKPGRWLSIVFQHWNTAYFEAILSSAAESGADLRAAISQVGDPVWSMHKKKGNESVLAGEMILTFLKSGKPKQIQRQNHFDLAEAIANILAASGDRIYGEYLFNRLIIEAWNRSAIGSLNITKSDFVDFLTKRGWRYDAAKHQWFMKAGIQASLFDSG